MSSSDRQYFKELRLQQFRGLLAVIQTESFSLAAKALLLTKASVWQQVRALEEEFGCVLLESVGRKIKPTANGLRLAHLATPLVEGFDSIKEAFSADLAKVPASLSVATTPSCLTYELRETIRLTRLQFPNAHLTFHDRNSPAAIDLLEAGNADIAVATRFEEWPEKPTLDFTKINEHPFAIAAPTGHPILTKKALQLTDLENFPILLPGPTANCRPRLEKLFRAAGIWERLQVILECSFPGSLLEYVDAGLGITVTPVPPALLLNQKNGLASIPGRQTILRDFSAVIGHEPVYLIQRRGWIETPIARVFRESLLHSRSA